MKQLVAQKQQQLHQELNYCNEVFTYVWECCIAFLIYVELERCKIMKKLVKRMKDEKGVVIVEATIVFPVMFFVLFFIIYMGNIYFEMAQMDDIAMRYCIKGAQSVADPMHYDMETYNALPIDQDVQPYRYIFGEVPGGSIDEIEDKIQEDIDEAIEAGSISFFKNMDPVLVSEPKAEFNNYVLYSTFTVEIEYQIPLPIKFFGDNRAWIADLNSRAEVSVNDTAEFIRNTDMVIDLVQGTELGNKIESFFNKIKQFLDKFASK